MIKKNILLIILILSLVKNIFPQGYNFLERKIKTSDKDIIKNIFSVKEEIKIDENGGFIFKPVNKTFPCASSSLKNDGYGPYTPDMVSDYKANTAWVEGVNGYGKGEWIAIQNDWYGTHITIYPSWGVKENWKKNNRIKKAKICIFIIFESNETKFKTSNKIIEGEITFPDKEDYFYLKLPDWKYESGGKFIAFLEIMDVYPGTSFNDTCVSWFSFDIEQ